MDDVDEYYDDEEDEYYDEEEGDFYSIIYEGSEFYDPNTPFNPDLYHNCNENENELFPPPLEDYTDVNTNDHPDLGFNISQEDAWSQTRQEVNYFRSKLGNNALEKLFKTIGSEDSELFMRFKRIGISNFEEYSLFMATFFLECQLSMTYQKLYDHPLVNTSDYLDPNKYKDLWKKIDAYNKSDNYNPRAWEDLEECLNLVLKELFLPTKQEFKVYLTVDDDKQWFNFTVKEKDIPLDENTTLSHTRHIRDNTPGVVVDGATYSGSGVPVHVHYRRKGEGEQASVKAAFKYLFKLGEAAGANLSGRVALAADRGFWNKGILLYVLSLGCDVFGTIKRLKWYPFYSNVKGPPETSDGRQFINTQGPPCAFQKTAKHNLGKPNDKDYNLNAQSWRNGFSSQVAHTISSGPPTNKIDVVISNAKSAREYLSNLHPHAVQRFRQGFNLVFGNDKKEHMEHLNRVIYPLTCGQGHQIWFIMRSLSCTSSVMDRIIRSKAPFINVDHPQRKYFEHVTEFAGFPDLLPRRPRNDGVNASNAGSSASESEDDSSDNHSICDEEYEWFINQSDEDTADVCDSEYSPYRFRLAENPQPAAGDDTQHDQEDLWDAFLEEDEEMGDAVAAAPDNDEDERDQGQSSTSGDSTSTVGDNSNEDERDQGQSSTSGDSTVGENSTEGHSADNSIARSPIVARRRRSSDQRHPYDLRGGNDDDDAYAGLPEVDEEDTDLVNEEEDADDADEPEEVPDIFDGTFTPQEFMDPFFHHLGSDMFHEALTEEAAGMIPNLSDEYVTACLDLIDRATTSGSADCQRERLLTWVQSTRAHRVTMFMTKAKLQELATDKDLYDEIKWSGKVPQLRKRLGDLLHKQEYPHLCDEDEDDVASGEKGYITEFLAAAFLRPQRKGNNEGQRNYAAMGHRAELPFINQFCEIMTKSGYYGKSEDQDLDAVYQCGLVRKKKTLHIRTSVDAVVIPVDNETGDLGCIPMEIKSRCAPRTYSRERQRIENARCGANLLVCQTNTHDVIIAEIDAFIPEDEEDDILDEVPGEEETFVDKKLNPLLHHVIPDKHELIQLLHHAVTWQVNSCFFVVGSNTKVMAIYRIFFPASLVHAYEKICNGFFKQDLQPFYKPGEVVPEPPQEWMDAFETAKLRKLKMDVASFKYFLGIWRVLNINLEGNTPGMQETYPFPLPPCIRIIPYVISFWNVMKGGVDTITHLLDLCQERVGIRTVNNMACARMLLYFGITFHRIHQWCGAKKDLKFYPSLSHARNANNNRATFADSLLKLSRMFLSQASRARAESSSRGIDGVGAETLDLDSILGVGDVEESSDTSRRRSSRRAVSSTPNPIKMEVAGFKTNKTPVERHGQNHDQSFQDRCGLCIGVYLGQLAPDPDDKTIKEDRIRRKCFICDTRTDYFCFGCRRMLCFKPANKDGKTIKGKKQPRFFTVDTPVLDNSGQLQVILERKKEEEGSGDDSDECSEGRGNREERKDGSYKSIKELAKWTCYHAAHQKGWEAYLKLNRQGMLDEVAGKGSKKRRSSFG